MLQELPVSLIKKFSNPYGKNIWDEHNESEGYVLTRQFVREYLESGELNSTPVDLSDDFDTTYDDFGRVAFFVKNGWSDPIKVNFNEKWVITDGNHRFAAAIYLRKKTILCEVVSEVS